MDMLFNFYTKFLNFLDVNIQNIIAAMLILVIGYFVIKLIKQIVAFGVRNSKIDKVVQTFLLNVIDIFLKFVLIIIAGIAIGIDSSTFVASIGAATLAIGLALKDSLSNFAAGMLLIFNKPFKVDDFIEIDGVSGNVKSMKFLHTILNTVDNKTIIIPNGKLIAENLINYSTQEFRRIDLVISVAYNSDLELVKNILQNLINLDSRINTSKENTVGILNLADSSIDFAFRVWCKNEDYWNLRFDILHKVKLEFDKNNIIIPFPQRTIHIVDSNRK